MDPQAALQNLIAAIKDGDQKGQEEHAQALSTWIANDGFMPVVDRDALGAFLSQILRYPATSMCRECEKEADIVGWIPSVNCPYCDHSDINEDESTL